MTRPEKCGAAGGAISLWVKIIDCDGGIISSVGNEGTSGLIIHCANRLRYVVFYLLEMALKVTLFSIYFQINFKPNQRGKEFTVEIFKTPLNN